MGMNKGLHAGLPALLLVLLSTVGGGVSAAEVYQSTDAQGNPVFSDRAPVDAPAKKVAIESAPPPADAERTRSEIERASRLADDLAAERKQEQQAKQASREEKSRREVACAAARSRLNQLTSQPPNRRLVTEPDGTSRRVSADEMQRLITQARTQAATDCQGVSSAASTATAAPATTGVKAQSPASRQKAAGSTERRKSSGSSARKKTE